MIELAPAYTSVAVFFDPIAVLKSNGAANGVFDELATRIRSAIIPASRRHRRRTAARGPRLTEIPVCYDAEFGFDLDRVAEHTKLSEREIVDLHSTREYRVACIGFVPGFTFLAGLPKNLATPRRDVPRKEIPAGSVGIGGAQTGIYPLRSPGGWNLIGRTPLKLFDPTKDPPTLLCPGRSRAFSRNYTGGVCCLCRDYGGQGIVEGLKRASCHVERSETSLIVSSAPPKPITEILHSVQNDKAMNAVVSRAGFLTSVQDLGRTGFRQFGVSTSGALDSFALRVANLLVGNDEGCGRARNHARWFTAAV